MCVYIRRPRPTQGGARQGREVVNTKTIHNNNNNNNNSCHGLFPIREVPFWTEGVAGAGAAAAGGNRREKYSFSSSSSRRKREEKVAKSILFYGFQKLHWGVFGRNSDAFPSFAAFTFAGKDFGFVGIGLRAFSSHFAFSTVFLIWPNQLSCEACCRGQISADCSRITVMVFQSPAMDSILGAYQDHVHALSTF